MAKKPYVIDTSVFLSDANALYRFKNNDIVIPIKVLEEIDKHKNRQDSVFFNARLIIKHLDESNSPLYSSKILDLDKNSLGEIFVLTSAGLLSFRSFNQASNQILNSIKVFPNPLILKEHEGLIINGLLKNNYIKILSLNGNEVISLNYRGGGINWNLLNRNNKKISPGIYLIYIVSEDGSQSFLTKFLVI